MNAPGSDSSQPGADVAALLQRSTVTVVGVGSVGAYASEALARAGVGILRLVDFDRVRDRDRARHPFAQDSTLGQPKAAAGQNRVRDINRACRVEAVQVFVNEETVAAVLDPEPGVLIDALDSMTPKLLLLREAVRRHVFCVSSMAGAGHVSPLGARVVPLAEAGACPFARLIGKRLQQEANDCSGVMCVTSARHGAPSEAAMDVDGAAAAGVFGLLAAREAVAYLVRSAMPDSGDDAPDADDDAPDADGDA